MTDLELAHCLTDDGIDATALVRALERLPHGTLPLHEACTQGGVVADSGLSFSVLRHAASESHVTLRLGVFFSEVVGGCNCHDDPVATHNYALFGLRIARSDGAAEFRLLSETDTGLE